MPSLHRRRDSAGRNDLLRFLVARATFSALMVIAVGLVGCGGGGGASETAKHDGGDEQNQRERRQGRQTPDASGKASAAKNDAPKTDNNAAKGQSSEAPKEPRKVVATPWNQKDLGDWKMLDYENAIKKQDLKFVSALDKLVASDADDGEKMQQIGQVLLLVSQMPDEGASPDLHGPAQPSRNRASNSPRRGSSRDDDEDY